MGPSRELKSRLRRVACLGISISASSRALYCGPRDHLRKAFVARFTPYSTSRGAVRRGVQPRRGARGGGGVLGRLKGDEWVENRPCRGAVRLCIGHHHVSAADDKKTSDAISRTDLNTKSAGSKPPSHPNPSPPSLPSFLLAAQALRARLTKTDRHTEQIMRSHACMHKVACIVVTGCKEKSRCAWVGNKSYEHTKAQTAKDIAETCRHRLDKDNAETHSTKGYRHMQAQTAGITPG